MSEENEVMEDVAKETVEKTEAPAKKKAAKKKAVKKAPKKKVSEPESSEVPPENSAIIPQEDTANVQPEKPETDPVGNAQTAIPENSKNTASEKLEIEPSERPEQNNDRHPYLRRHAIFVLLIDSDAK